MLLLKGRFLCKRQNRAQESAILTGFQVMLIELVFGPVFTCKVLKHLSRFCCSHVWASLVAQIGKVSTCNVGYLGLIPGLGRSPEKGKATHSSILAWNSCKIPWTVWSMGLQRVRRNWEIFIFSFNPWGMELKEGDLTYYSKSSFFLADRTMNLFIRFFSIF